MCKVSLPQVKCFRISVRVQLHVEERARCECILIDNHVPMTTTSFGPRHRYEGKTKKQRLNKVTCSYRRQLFPTY